MDVDVVVVKDAAAGVGDDQAGWELMTGGYFGKTSQCTKLGMGQGDDTG